MKTKLLLTIALVCMAVTASADNYKDMESLTLSTPEMKAELVPVANHKANPYGRMEMRSTLRMETGGWKPDFDFFKSKTNPGVKPYKFMDELTFVGVPLFVAGIAIKGDKAMFAQNNKNGKKNTQLLTDFKTSIDDYTQYFGPALTVGLKLGGYEGRSDWPRLLASAGMSYAIMAALVNGIKYTAKEMRPDGSSANSWPSGHTATSFVGATLLHKEYGLTRSPWFSIAGYGVATATGVMRVHGCDARAEQPPLGERHHVGSRYRYHVDGAGLCPVRPDVQGQGSAAQRPGGGLGQSFVLQHLDGSRSGRQGP